MFCCQIYYLGVENLQDMAKKVYLCQYNFRIYFLH
jgi:hypothetical protein